MENVFEGIHISTGESDVRSFRDLSSRHSLGGYTVGSIEVSRATDQDEPSKPRPRKRRR